MKLLKIKFISIKIQGLVQGVGFRPFIYRLAKRFNVKGEVNNTSEGVFIKAILDQNKLKYFLEAIEKESPPASSIFSISCEEIESFSADSFKITKSRKSKKGITEISPDIAVCKDCLKDMKVQKHRINYPLTNCTNCGPRFSIIKSLPYDRAKTTMKDFPMCEKCRKEYEDVLDRRFHAQPVACNLCGPKYKFILKNGEEIDNIKEIVRMVAKMINKGKVLAIKGLGGFHLVCNAFDNKAISRIRKFKKRSKKPLALMFKDVKKINNYCKVNQKEEQILTSWKRPIVLLRKKKKSNNKSPDIASNITGNLNTLGIMLPYMPFHHLLFRELEVSSLVFTSGNVSGEPIIIQNKIAISKFSKLVDGLVIYNREIENRLDDSVVFCDDEEERMIRRSRGYAPRPFRMKYQVDGILSVGAELNSTFCVGNNKQAVPSQYMGDLKNLSTYEFFESNIEKFKKLFKSSPQIIAHDMHPDYLSTKYAKQFEKKKDVKLLAVQHHHAHIASCMAEYGLNEKVVGVAFDGMGYGVDGKIWGGEFFVCDLQAFERQYHFENIPMPGGDKVVQEPFRMSIAYLFSMGLKKINEYPVSLQKDKQRTMKILKMLEKDINCPETSSVGRLFDAVSAMTGLCTKSTFHAEAPMRLESELYSKELNPRYNEKEHYDFIISDCISVKSMMEQILNDVHNNVEKKEISFKFHNTLVKMIIEVCKEITQENNIKKVILSGGVFQNKFLLSNTEEELKKLGFKVYSNKIIPSNDGGISLGQLAVAAQNL
ncbi:carbamoyltransferase HypF [Candidatus Dojkabacteria bacterium]|nr:carbamoyltransferase HypF [Candidatus Dojkabacteria bacterium]